MPRLLTRGKRRRRNRLQGGRLHLGTLAGITSERWPTSARNRWPACVGILHPVFLTQTLKATGSIVGLVDGAAQATQNIVQGFSGALSDKLQRRKSIALAGYLLAALAKPLTGLATVWQGVLGQGCWTGSAPGPARRPVTPSSHRQSMNRIEAERSDSKALATMRVPSLGRCLPCCSSMRRTSTCAGCSTSRSYRASWLF